LESAAPPELSLLKLDAFWSRAAFRAAACLPVVPLVLAPFWAKRAAARFVRTAFFAAAERSYADWRETVCLVCARGRRLSGFMLERLGSGFCDL
jgi:hypothetical protein